jgi:hypothetical protein
VNKILPLYKTIFISTLALYIYLGKGIAYGYFAELLLLIGILLLIKQRRSVNLIKGNTSYILYFLLFINLFYLARGIVHFGIMDTIRDSFILNYIYFVFILLLFEANIEEVLKSIFKIYKYYPAVLFCLYLISLNDFIGNISIFGDVHLLFFKFGDIGVHLFVAFILQINNLNRYKKPFDLLNYLCIFILFSVASSYSRSGMLSFIIAFLVFYYFLNDKAVKDQLRSFVKYVPIVFVISLLFLSKFKVADNFQGRTVGVEQVALNFTSIFSTSEEGGLNDNKIWRLLWWGQIIDYTFNGPFFVAGKGLGISLADDDQILTTDLEGDLRSPHNFSLSVLARYGVFIFTIWLYWIILQLKRIKTINLSKLQLVIICIQIAFLFNAHFDVFLEGPMGAFPFWVFVGIDLIFNYFKLYNTSLEHDLFKISLEKSV